MSKRYTKLTRPGEGGFTLLELVMVMTIIVILAAVSISSYQHVQLKARETILKENLRVMRRALDQFTADKERLPQSLDELVSEQYLHAIPPDPITEQVDWEVKMGDDEFSLQGGQGVIDVNSSAPGEGSDGKAYREY
ncbi:MAG TPA: type II secretion system protein [Blastocatellia bacterium]|nr:type II secretion system protein [Blastocatellia bacterium]